MGLQTFFQISRSTCHTCLQMRQSMPFSRFLCSKTFEHTLLTRRINWTRWSEIGLKIPPNKHSNVVPENKHHDLFTGPQVAWFWLQRLCFFGLWASQIIQKPFFAYNCFCLFGVTILMWPNVLNLFVWGSRRRRACAHGLYSKFDLWSFRDFQKSRSRVICCDSRWRRRST